MNWRFHETTFTVNPSVWKPIDPRGVFEAEGAVWAEADSRAASEILSRAADDAALRQRLGAQAARVAAERFSGSELLAAHHALTRGTTTHADAQRVSA